MDIPTASNLGYLRTRLIGYKHLAYGLNHGADIFGSFHAIDLDCLSKNTMLF